MSHHGTKATGQWFACAVLLIALALRLCIVAQGGAYFWTDEKRYHHARAAALHGSRYDDAGHSLDPTRGLHLLKRSTLAERFAPYPGPLALRLTLPRNRAGRIEALLSHGGETAQHDQVLIHYADVNRIRLGFRQGAGTPPRGQSHRV
jgi:hypothetical protein